jgi:hypothetical protein
MMDSMESDLRENEAREKGVEWANNSIVDDEEDEVIKILTANNTSTIPEPTNEFIPKTLEEAKTRWDLWGEAMEKEIGKMEERTAWVAMVKLKDVKVVGVKWV